MGFPVGHSVSAIPLPTFLLFIALLLCHLRRLIFAAFNVDVGHGLPSPPTSSGRNRSNFPLFYSGPAKLNALPVVRYGEAAEEAMGDAEPCAVCLSELERGDEVRRLSNCRHVFHRGCLDRWVEHEQRLQSTCPLCRTQLVPDAAVLNSY